MADGHKNLISWQDIFRTASNIKLDRISEQLNIKSLYHNQLLELNAFILFDLFRITHKMQQFYLIFLYKTALDSPLFSQTSPFLCKTCTSTLWIYTEKFMMIARAIAEKSWHKYHYTQRRMLFWENRILSYESVVTIPKIDVPKMTENSSSRKFTRVSSRLIWTVLTSSPLLTNSIHMMNSFVSSLL